MDKRIFSLGVSMFVVGLVVNQVLSTYYPTATAGMSDTEKQTMSQKEAVNSGLMTMSQTVAALGFLILLISVGLKRRKGDGGKTITQKPTQAG